LKQRGYASCPDAFVAITQGLRHSSRATHTIWERTHKLRVILASTTWAAWAAWAAWAPNSLPQDLSVKHFLHIQASHQCPPRPQEQAIITTISSTFRLLTRPSLLVSESVIPSLWSAFRLQLLRSPCPILPRCLALRWPGSVEGFDAPSGVTS